MSNLFESFVELPIEIRERLESFVDGLDASDLGASSVTATQLATDAVETAKIKALNVTSEKLEVGVLSADAVGRALMASDLFDATTALAKFATDSIANAFLVKAIADGAFAADGATRALFADGFVTASKIISGAIDRTKMADNTISPDKVNGSGYFVKEEDFPLDAGGTLPAPLAKDVQADATGDYLADAANGVYSLATAVTSEAQAAQLTYGDQLILDPTKNLVFEARVRLNIPGATPTADERWVVGLASAHANSEDSLDAVVSHVWFRGEGASLSVFVEGDDAAIDTDDQDSTIDYVDNTWMLLKIDMSDLAAVEFSIDGAAAGTVDVSGLDATKVLQPIFCYQRDAGDEINLLEVDWYRVYQDRS